MQEKKSLIMFYSVDCEHCEAMLPTISELLQEEGIELDLVEVDKKDQESVDLYDKYEAGNCGGVPLFVNTKNLSWLCGEVTKSELRDWALSK